MSVEEPLEVSLEGTQESSEQQQEEEEEEKDVYTTLFQSRQRKMVSVGQTGTKTCLCSLRTVTLSWLFK